MRLFALNDNKTKKSSEIARLLLYFLFFFFANIFIGEIPYAIVIYNNLYGHSANKTWYWQVLAEFAF